MRRPWTHGYVVKPCGGYVRSSSIDQLSDSWRLSGRSRCHMQCRAFGHLLKWWLPNRVPLTPWRPLQDVLSVLVNLVVLRLTWQIVYDFCVFFHARSRCTNHKNLLSALGLPVLVVLCLLCDTSFCGLRYNPE